jgi:hypothetical protein
VSKKKQEKKITRHHHAKIRNLNTATVPAWKKGQLYLAFPLTSLVFLGVDCYLGLLYLPHLLRLLPGRSPSSSGMFTTRRGILNMRNLPDTAHVVL